MGRGRACRLADHAHDLDLLNGGYSGAHFDSFAVDNLTMVTPPPAMGFSVASHNYNGWFIGTGVEGQLPFFGKGWFIRTEYRYADYGETTLPVTAAGGAIATVGGIPVDVKLHPIVQTVRTEVTYKFNWFGQ